MKKYLLTILAFAIIAPVVVKAQTTMRVDVPNVVAENEQFNVTFIIDGDDNPSDFQWDAGSDFRVVWGPQSGRTRNTSVINGQRTRTVQSTFTYILIPLAEGNFTIPSATVKLKDGSTLSSKPVSIEVVKAGSSSGSGGQGNQGNQGGNSGSGGSNAQAGTVADNDLFLRFTLSRANVVVGEPITATLKLYQRVNITGFEDVNFPVFNGFWSQEVEAPTNIEFQRENVGGEIYNTALLRKYVLIPQQTGTLTIDPAELVCLVSVRVPSSGGSSIFDSFFFDDQRTIRKRVTSQPARVVVSPLPSGAPASFGGGVGSFTMSAVLSKNEMATHEAVSLVVTVNGQGNVSLLEAPKVSFPPDMEVYDTKISEKLDKGSGGTSGSKVYEFPFIPRSYGDFEIPPISYSYYDSSAGKYVTLTTQTIPYHVEKGNETAASSGSGVQGVDRSGVRNLNSDIRFITVKMPRLSSKGNFFVFSTAFILIIAVLFALAVALWLALRQLAARRADVVGTKTRKANKVAVKRLRLAGDFLKQNLYTAFYEELHKTMIGYVSDKLNISMSDLSKESVAGQLLEGGVREETVAQFTEIIEACEFARYSPETDNSVMAGYYDRAVNVISSIESEMKGKKINKSAAVGGAAVIILLLGLSVNGLAAENDFVDSLWLKASDAYTAGQWDEAIADYEMIASFSLESPALYCNIGNAYFKSEDYPHAILYYERALKLDPSHSDARYNLDIANTMIQDRIDAVPEFVIKSWVRKLCYKLDSDSWAIICIVMFALFLAMFLLFLLAARTAVRRTGFFVSIVVLCLTGLTLWFSLWQRVDYETADSAIVTRPVSTVKSSPSDEVSTDLFILHEGTKVTILDEVGSWRNISLADGRQGWMRSDEMEVI